MPSILNRRSYVKLLAAGSTVALAGCSEVRETVGLGESEVPSYADWLTPIDRSELSLGDVPPVMLSVDADVGFTYVDVSLIGNETDQSYPSEYTEDPLIVTPTLSVFAGHDEVQTLEGLGLRGLVSDAENASLETTADALLMDHLATILLGDFDTTEIDAALTEDTGEGPVFEQTDEVGDVDVYTATGGGDTVPVGLGDGAVIIANRNATDQVGAIQTKVDAKNGDTTRAVDEYDEFEWLLKTAGDGQATTGLYGESTGALKGDEESDTSGIPIPLLDNGRGVVGSLTIVDDDGGESTSEAPSVDADLAAYMSDYEESNVEDVVGGSAEESSVEFDDDQIEATGTWTDATLVDYFSGSA